MLKHTTPILTSLLLLGLCFAWPHVAIAENLPSVTLEPIATGLADPLGVVDAGDSSGRLFIVLQGGQVVILANGNVLDTPFLDIRERVRSGDERGLLGLVFHPQFQANGFFYVNYTDLQGHTVISRFQVSSVANIADNQSELILLTIEQPFANHNGGQIQFGPDEFLYIGTGDGGAGGDPQNRAQNLGDLLGKMLRIDVNGDDFPTDPERNYTIPANNPFINNPGALNEIWAYGLRNPWRFSFDHLTGALFIGDVGQGVWEEIDRQPLTSSGGENYGWRSMEGKHCFNPEENCPLDGLTLPIVEYPHNLDNEFLGCAVIGGYQYRGMAIPQLFGMYIYGDFCSGKIWAAHESNGEWETEILLDSGRLITSFGEDQNGSLFVSDAGTGSILRMTGPKVGGCVTLNGEPLADRKVNLKQVEETKQKTRTDTDGCFTFDQIVPGKKFEITIKGPVAP